MCVLGGFGLGILVLFALYAMPRQEWGQWWRDEMDDYLAESAAD
jgi:hypothetical protein